MAGPRPPSENPSALADGYRPLDDLGLIGDDTTATLVARDGAIRWLCMPQFDLARLTRRPR